MQTLRRVTGFMIALLIPFGVSAPVFADSQSITQEIHVTAVVPSHRDIVLDYRGNISQIFSNTKDDVTPDAYRGSVSPGNKRPLSPELYAQYRKLVPVGTARYGTLYKRPVVADLLSTKGQLTSAPAFFSRMLSL
jgi:hypothetical protein